MRRRRRRPSRDRAAAAAGSARRRRRSCRCRSRRRRSDRWPASASGITALWIGRVSLKPRSRMPSSSRGSRPSEANGTGVGVDGDRLEGRRACDGRRDGVRCAGCGRRATARARAPRGRRGCRDCQLCWNSNCFWLASAEGDDAPDRIVGRDADGHAIAGNHLDAEAAHAAAQLGQHLVAGVALHAVQARRCEPPRRCPACRSDRPCSTASSPFLQTNIVPQDDLRPIASARRQIPAVASRTQRAGTQRRARAAGGPSGRAPRRRRGRSTCDTRAPTRSPDLARRRAISTTGAAGLTRT